MTPNPGKPELKIEIYCTEKHLISSFYCDKTYNILYALSY
jgi:hypothetical protein